MERLRVKSEALEEMFEIEEHAIKLEPGEIQLDCLPSATEVTEVKTEEMLTSKIEIEEHGVKLETGEDELDCSEVAMERLQVRLEPFEEMLTSEIEEHVVKLEPEKDQLDPLFVGRTSSTNLLVHYRKKTYSCEECAVKYKYAEILAWHDLNCHGTDAILKVENIENKHRYVCVLCQLFYTSPYYASQHLLNHHNINTFTLQCNNCEKYFLCKADVMQHQRKPCKKKDVHADLQMMSGVSHISQTSNNQREIDSPVPGTPLLTPIQPSNTDISMREAIQRNFETTNDKSDPSEIHSTPLPTLFEPRENVSEDLQRHSELCNDTNNASRKVSQVLSPPVPTPILPCKNTKTNVPPRVSVSSHPSNSKYNASRKVSQVLSPPVPTPILPCKNTKTNVSPRVSVPSHPSNSKNNASRKVSQVSKTPIQNHNNGSKNYECEKCGLGYSEPEMLGWHNKYCHGTNLIVKVLPNSGRAPSYECCVCASIYQDILLLMHHLHLQHGLKDLPFKCSVCEKAFILKVNLEKHEYLCKKSEVERNTLLSCSSAKDPSISILLGGSLTVCWTPDVPPVFSIDTNYHNGTSSPTPIQPDEYVDRTSQRRSNFSNNTFQSGIVNQEPNKPFRPDENVILPLNRIPEGPSNFSTATVGSGIVNQITTAPLLTPFDSRRTKHKCSECGVVYFDSGTLAWHMKNRHGTDAVSKVVRLERNVSDFSMDSNYQSGKSSQIPNTSLLTPMCQNVNSSMNSASKNPYNFNNDQIRSEMANQLPCSLIQTYENVSTSTNRTSKNPYNFNNDKNQNPEQVLSSNPIPTPIRASEKTKTSYKFLKCDWCDIIYADGKTLALHIEKCHGGDTIIKFTNHQYQCVICKIEFRELRKVVAHLRDQHQCIKLPQRCIDCDSQFILKSDFQKHRLKCKSNTGQGLSKNMKHVQQPAAISMEPKEGHRVHGNNDVPLKECRVLLRKLLECDFCCFYTDNKTQLATHMQAHLEPNTADRSNEESLQECEECGVKFSQPKMYVWHIENCHGSEAIVNVVKIGGRIIYECDFCKTQCTSMRSIIAHLHSRHRIGILPFSCNKCDKQYTRKHNFKMHKCSSNKIFNVSPSLSHKDGVCCKMCNLKLNSEKLLKEHILKNHAVVREIMKRKFFQCLHCDKYFPYFPHLKTHCCTKQPGKNMLQCKECQANFNSHSAYKYHKYYQHNTLVCM